MDILYGWAASPDSSEFKKLRSLLWQRVVRARSIEVTSTGYFEKNVTYFILSSLVMLNNIQTIRGNSNVNDISILKAIMHQCGDKIKHFELDFHSYERSRTTGKQYQYPDPDFRSTDVKTLLPPLQLLTAEKIWIFDSYLHLGLSFKCEELYFNMVKNLIVNGLIL